MSKIDIFINTEDYKNPKVEITEKKNLIFCHKSQKHYWDDGFVRNFEKVILYDITWEEAKSKYPNCVKVLN
tara:strand:+ start:598 stop:810 length:213 start_codon:yes stop_codon:yes gene_type:complete